MKTIWIVGLALILLILAITLVEVAHRHTAAPGLGNGTDTAMQGPMTQSPGTEPASEVVPERPEFERAVNPDGTTRVYRTLLPGKPGEEWSEVRISKTKKGACPYLGDFRPADPITLTIPALPPHKLLQISFDLFLMRSWDGSSPNYGYARWDLDVDDRNLIHTTFNNCGFFSDNNKEAFPDTWPARWHTAWTLAAEHETFGVMQTWGTFTGDASSVYHFVLAFPHSEPNATFQFESHMEKNPKKFYGLTNVEVSTLPELASYPDDKFAMLWSDLGSSDTAAFWKAQWELTRAGDATTHFIASHLSENVDLTSDQLKKAVMELEGADEARTNAIYSLIVQQGCNGVNPVTAMLGDSSVPPLARQRLSEWLDNITFYAKYFPESATELRNERAKHLLNIIHTPAALALAEKIPDLVRPPLTH